jgi:hypothetical protein
VGKADALRQKLHEIDRKQLSSQRIGGYPQDGWNSEVFSLRGKLILLSSSEIKRISLSKIEKLKASCES